MKQTPWLTLSIASCLLGGDVAQAEPPGSSWQLVLEDQFDGTQLDPSLWTIHTGARRDAINTADAISVADGNLTITTYTSGGRHYTGFISTRNSFLGTFGYWEARVRFDDASGMWSAFWMQSPTMGDPIGDPATAGAEIDIVEHRFRDSAGSDISNKAQHTVHWDGYGAYHRSVASFNNNPGPVPLQGNFHTYGLLWTPAAYQFFVDGVPRWTTNQGLSHRSEFIYVTSEVMDNSWAGQIPPGGYGERDQSQVRMIVDWVRVWQRPLYGSDIGAVSLAGRDDLDESGTWTVQGSGDIWGSSDRCHFVYLPMVRDGWILAQVSGIDNPDPDAKAGVMIRESLAADAKNAALFLKAGSRLELQSRDTNGGATTALFSIPEISAPYGLYLERAGDDFSAWGTTDYQSWQYLGTTTIPMTDRVYIGLVVTNHHSPQINTAYFDYVTGSFMPP
jgi:beta-glucanase (GH16 family)